MLKRLVLLLVAALCLIALPATATSSPSKPPAAVKALKAAAIKQAQGNVPTKAKSAKTFTQNTYCNLWSIGQKCITPWNYTHDVQINSGGAGTQVVFCFAHHPDGSWTGGTTYVFPGGSGFLHPTGYNQTVCEFQSGGPGGFPIAIYAYIG